MAKAKIRPTDPCKHDNGVRIEVFPHNFDGPHFVERCVLCGIVLFSRAATAKEVRQHGNR